jgi:hypothetical protein
MKTKSPEKQLASFMAKYTPAVRALASEILAKMRTLLPGAIEMVYDNYNALVIGFGPTERPSEAVFSIVLNPRWVSICFIQGASLDDPLGILRGEGNQVRHIRLLAAEDFDRPEMQAMMEQAIEASPKPFDAGTPGRLIIKSISVKQRPRRPK